MMLDIISLSVMHHFRCIDCGNLKWKGALYIESFESKKLALIRILQILKEYSDFEHPLTQEKISEYLKSQYGISIERKAISRNISLLKEADIPISSTRNGSYLEENEFENSELHLLIDGILCSKYITKKQSIALIDKLRKLSNRYFKVHVKNIYTLTQQEKTDNQDLFYNIEIIDEAIEKMKMVQFDFNKYGIDKKLHKSSSHKVMPYRLILHNQRYYLMALHEDRKELRYYRLDHITNMKLLEDSPLTDIHMVKSYTSDSHDDPSISRPYLFTDKAEYIEFITEEWMMDQVIEWFGFHVKVKKLENGTIHIRVKSSPRAVEYWAMQFLNYIEVINPPELRERIKSNLQQGLDKYTVKESAYNNIMDK